MLLPIQYFFLMIAVGAVFVLFLPIWWIVPFDLMTVSFFGNWSIGFLRIGPNDLSLLFIAAAFLLRGRLKAEWRRQKVPLLLPWVVLAACFCLSYYLAPVNQRNLTDPVRIVYQLLRYGVRPVAYLPVALLLLRSPRRAYLATFFVLLAADHCSLIAIHQGYTGRSDTPGPFRSGNQLGGVLIMPTLLALAGAVLPRTRAQRIFCAVSLVLMARALLFSASRGSMVAVVFGVLVFCAILPTRNLGRQRVRYFAPFALVGLLAVAPLLPVIASRPTVAHALSAADGRKASTMQWRMQERWPHFWGIAVDNPWFGIGIAVDPSLGRHANTPHNGFLSLLVIYGFPAFLLILFFALRTFWNGLRLYWQAPNPDHKAFGLASAAAISGILVHQMVEVTLTAPFTFKVFWILVATNELARSWYDDDDEAEVGSKDHVVVEDPLWEPLPERFEPRAARG